MNFAGAIEALKEGRAVARHGYTHRIILIPESDITVQAGRPLAAVFSPGTALHYEAHLAEVDALLCVRAWRPREEDLLASDWYVPRCVGPICDTECPDNCPADQEAADREVAIAGMAQAHRAGAESPR